MKKFAFITIVASLAFAFEGQTFADDLFGSAGGSDLFSSEGVGGSSLWDATETPKKQTATIAIINSELHSEEMTDTGADEPDEMSDADVEVPGGPTIFPEEVKGDIGKCRQYSNIFQPLITKYCQPGTKIKVSTICGMWKREGVPNMCLGGTRGEVCKVSSAGAEGPFQCLPKTAKYMLKDRPYNPQSLEDSAECGIQYLCKLEQQVGERNMFYAYQSGPAGDFSRPNPQTYDRTVRKFIAMFEGAGDLTSTYAGGVGVPPIDPGKAYISSGFGAFRPSHPTTPHQGQDWAANPGTAVRATFDSTVTIAGWTGTAGGKRCGGQVAFAMGNGDIGSLALIRYCHLSRVVVKAGAKVKAGDIVGYIGAKNDGLSGVNSSGAHLHWETHVVVSKTVMNGKTRVKTAAYAVMAKWFDLSPFIAGTMEQNPRYQGPRDPAILNKTAKFWTKP